MKHLTDEQLGARLDGELPAKSAAAVESHLAACAGCRERLAALAGSDAALASALVRDPGEPYFASFAGRVQARIAAAAAAGAARPAHAADPAPARTGWLARPSTLAWAGAATALVAVGAFAVQFATQQMAGGNSARPTTIVGADRLERREAAPPADAPAPAPAAQAPAPAAARAPGGNESGDVAIRTEPERQRAARTLGELQAAAPQAKAEAPAKERDAAADTRALARDNAPVAPQRLQEMRTLPNGEQAPVETRALPRAAKQKSLATAPGEQARVPKPLAMPLTPVASEKRSATTPQSSVRGGRADEAKASVPAPAVDAAPPSAAGSAEAPGEAAGTALRAEAEEAPATFRICGKVTDSSGRALAHATVTVVETGRSVATDSDGGYCVEASGTRATLGVLSVGFHEYRATVRPADAAGPYAVSLRAVQTLGSGGAPVARFKAPALPGAPVVDELQSPAPATRSLFAKDQAAGKLTTIAPLAGETADARAAREATETALRTRTVPTWSRAGALWERVALAAAPGAAAHEARYRAAEARMNAWRLARGSSNRRAAAEAIEACLAKAPAGPQRDSVESWRRELPGR